MKIVKTVKDWKTLTEGKKNTVGFVPTMGALHMGHISLVRRSRAENTFTAVSIFLNRTQFNEASDYEKYPVSLESDISLLEKEGVDCLFLPDYQEIYPHNYRFKITESEFSRQLCGASRPGHFDGVLTVVNKLFGIIKPNKAYFGEKDYQQFLLIKDMAEAFFLDVKIVPCPIVREDSGLAMSSRNRRLSEEGIKKASEFYRALSSGKIPEEIRKELEAKGFSVDYVTEIDRRLYGAVFLEGIRLIDNVKV